MKTSGIYSTFCLHPSNNFLKRPELSFTVDTLRDFQFIERIVKKGDELGYFAFGGSCILTFFEKNKVTLSDDLVNASRNGIELYAKMGEEMGFIKDPLT